jgi:O-antigen/teichoic acid export membrane protein
MAPESEPRARSSAWRRFAVPLLRLAGGVGAAAIGTYVYLIVVARDLGPAGYATFSGFWAVVVILGAGVYLPIEQETGRRGVDVRDLGGPRRSLGRSAVLAALVVTAALAALLLASWPAVDEFLGSDVVLAAALVLGAVGYAAQYPVRGLLSAERRYGWYASVLGAEALLRVVLVLALVALADPDPGVLAGVVGVAALGSAVVGLAGARSGGLRLAGGPMTLLRSTGVLITGAVALQTLLYGAVLVGRLLPPDGQEEAAGRLLAAITVTRIPIFLFQSLEALVVPRIAELALRGDVPVLVAAVRRLVLLVAALGAATVLGSALAGPALVSLMFGADFTVSHTTMALLGLGTGVFMVAVALSDVTVSLGGHARMALSWVAGLVAGALSLLVIPSFDLQVTLPLVVGSVVAAGLLGRAAQVRVQDLAVPAAGR